MAKFALLFLNMAISYALADIAKEVSDPAQYPCSNQPLQCSPTDANACGQIGNTCKKFENICQLREDNSRRDDDWQIVEITKCKNIETGAIGTCCSDQPTCPRECPKRELGKEICIRNKLNNKCQLVINLCEMDNKNCDLIAFHQVPKYRCRNERIVDSPTLCLDD